MTNNESARLLMPKDVANVEKALDNIVSSLAELQAILVGGATVTVAAPATSPEAKPQLRADGRKRGQVLTHKKPDVSKRRPRGKRERSHGRVGAKPRFDLDTAAYIRKMAMEGMTTATLAGKFDVSTSAIHNVLSGYGCYNFTDYPISEADYEALIRSGRITIASQMDDRQVPKYLRDALKRSAEAFSQNGKAGG